MSFTLVDRLKDIVEGLENTTNPNGESLQKIGRLIAELYESPLPEEFTLNLIQVLEVCRANLDGRVLIEKLVNTSAEKWGKLSPAQLRQIEEWLNERSPMG